MKIRAFLFQFLHIFCLFFNLIFSLFLSLKNQESFSLSISRRSTRFYTLSLGTFIRFIFFSSGLLCFSLHPLFGFLSPHRKNISVLYFPLSIFALPLNKTEVLNSLPLLHSHSAALTCSQLVILCFLPSFPSQFLLMSKLCFILFLDRFLPILLRVFILYFI